MPEQGAVRANPQECSPGIPFCLWAEPLILHKLSPLQTKSQPSGGAEQTLVWQSLGRNVLDEEHGHCKGKSPGVKAAEWV